MKPRDCFSIEPALLSLDAAYALLAERIRPATGTEVLPLRQCLGRILATDLVARLAQPPFDNSAMDGFAVRHAELASHGPSRLRIGARIAAGHPLSVAVPVGSAAEIFTGAPIPDGFDTVVVVEDCKVTDDQGQRFVTMPGEIRRGHNVRHAGEDFACGETVLKAGRRLRPQDIAMAATNGETALLVYERMAVGVFSTGDELVEPGTPLAPGKIYDSNRFALIAVLESLGHDVTDLGHLPDEPVVITAALRDAADRFHALVTSGGVSVGGEDHVTAVVEKLGALHFWKLALKPGKPVALGQIGGTAFLGLPGNPVSAIVTLLVVGRALLRALSGATGEPALPTAMAIPAGFEYKKTAGRRQFLRGTIARQELRTTASLFRSQDSNILSSLTETDGLIDLGDTLVKVTPGDPVDFLPYASLLW